MVTVSHRRWLFARGSNCKALTGKILVFWIGSHLWEVIAYETWLDFPLHLQMRKLPIERVSYDLEKNNKHLPKPFNGFGKCLLFVLSANG